MSDLSDKIPLLPILMQRPPASTDGASAGIDRAVALGSILFRLVEGEASFAFDKMAARAYHDSSAARELSAALGCDAALLNPDLALEAAAAPMSVEAAIGNGRRAFRAAVAGKMAAAAAELLGPDLFALAARWAAGYFEADFALAERDEAVKQHLDQVLGLAPTPIHARPPADLAWLATTPPPTPRARLLLALRGRTLHMLSFGGFVATGIPALEETRVRINIGLWKGPHSPAQNEGAIIFGYRGAQKKLFDVEFSRAAGLPAAEPKQVEVATPRLTVERKQLLRAIVKLLVENREMFLRKGGPAHAAGWIYERIEQAPGVPWKRDTILRHVMRAWSDLEGGTLKL